MEQDKDGRGEEMMSADAQMNVQLMSAALERQNLTEEKRNLLDSLLKANRETDSRRAATCEHDAGLRAELQRKESRRVELLGEVGENLKCAVDQAVGELKAVETKPANLNAKGRQEDEKVTMARLQNNALKEKLEMLTEAAISAEKKVEKVKQSLEEVEQADKAALSKLSQQQSTVERDYRQQKELLYKQIKKKQKEIVDLENQIKQHREQSQGLADFTKHVRKEVSRVQELCAAAEKDAESLMHDRAVMEREIGSLRQETATLDKELAALGKRRDAQKKNILTANRKLDRMTVQLMVDQQTLDAEVKKMACREEDTMVLLNYTLKDQKKIKLEYDRTAELFQQVDRNMKEVKGHCETSSQHMSRRDKEMDQCIESLSLLKKAALERQNLTEEKRNLLDSLRKANSETDSRRAAACEHDAGLRAELQRKESRRVELLGECETLKCTVDRAAGEVKAAKTELDNLNAQVKEEDEKVKKARLQNDALKEKLEMLTAAAISAEKKAEEMEQSLKEAEQTNKEMDSQYFQRGVEMNKIALELQALRGQEQPRVAEISAGQAALSKLSQQQSTVERDYRQQKELLYKQDLQIVLLEKKVDELAANEDIKEVKGLRRKEAELTGALKEKQQEALTLRRQLQQQEMELRCAKKEAEKTSAEKSNLATKVEELGLHDDASDRELNRLRLKKQDTMVDENLLKLDVKRLRDEVQSQADKVVAMEMKRLQLEAGFKEKEAETAARREELRTQLKNAEQGRHKTRAELNEKLLQSQKMKEMYEALAASTMTFEGEEVTLEQYMVKAAKRKEELQRRRDEWSNKLLQKEREVKALGNTVAVLKGRNEAIRTAPKTTEEYEKKATLEQKHKALCDKYALQSQQQRDLRRDIKAMETELEGLLQEEVLLMVTSDQNQTLIQDQCSELDAQEEELNKAIKQSSELTEEIRSKNQTAAQTEEEKDVRLRELEDFSKQIDQLLLEAMEENADLRSVLQAQFLEKKQDLPTPVFTSTPRSSDSSNSACSIEANTVKRASSRQAVKATLTHSSASSPRDAELRCSSNTRAPALQFNSSESAGRRGSAARRSPRLSSKQQDSGQGSTDACYGSSSTPNSRASSTSGYRNCAARSSRASGNTSSSSQRAQWRSP
ncbi:coiled-coil domain-containing protein 39-like [Megalops cyprinoides]|uniref:coiled-coil domain-containing protein 39-like n=1 Tax=Megalops cyprinoides TaxID=118141 RepID=UPI001864A789|nr:coiled-coil domain-containing protein 39-like [Megalops cyprinoides]